MVSGTRAIYKPTTSRFAHFLSMPVSNYLLLNHNNFRDPEIILHTHTLSNIPVTDLSCSPPLTVCEGGHEHL